jgi:hypothetical protein
MTRERVRSGAGLIGPLVIVSNTRRPFYGRRSIGGGLNRLSQQFDEVFQRGSELEIEPMREVARKKW